MDLRHLRYFVAVAEARNFNRAAERLHIAQPPLSRAIQHLETELGVTLIDRSSRPLGLTATGRLFLEQATQILARMDSLRSMVGLASSARRRRFTIGFVASTIYARLPDLIRGFRAAAPDVELTLLEMVSLDQVAALKDGRIDVGFGRIRFEDDTVRRTVLREERLMLAVPAAHPLARHEGPLSLAAMECEPMILYPREPRPSYADQVLTLFADLAIRPVIAHEARELQTAIGLVAAEEGLCVVPESVQKSRVDDVVFRELIERPVSPIILSHRIHDQSPELMVLARIIIRSYSDWGYAIPHALDVLGAHRDR